MGGSVYQDISQVIYIEPRGYNTLSVSDKHNVARLVGKINKTISREETPTMILGPGRWGTSTPDLGVHVTYSDIYNTHALVELAGESVGASREPSFGTHFFQDLMEADIYPLGIFLDDKNTIFKRDFFYDTPSHLSEFVAVDNPRVANALRLIAVSDYRPNHHLDLIMDAHKSYAVAFLVGEEDESKTVDGDETMVSGLPPVKE